ncbi:replication initiator protein [Microvirus D_HF4_320]|nr:replication initiator protein [Microvirus D_HF4_320]
MHQENSFLTLTLDEEHYKPSLDHRDFQLFMKRLRAQHKRALGKGRRTDALDRNNNRGRPANMGHSPIPLSYYMAGEYGSQHRRPHYHACIFGWRPKDLIYWRKTKAGSKLYTSEHLDKLWGKGFTSIGDVNFESAAYIARYIMAKITGKDAWKYYQHVNEDTGEITDLKPEYNRMSLGKATAIGKTWLQKYKTDVYPEGKILVRKFKSTTPEYYDRQYKKEEPNQYEQMKMERELQALEYRNDNTDSRLKAKERVKRAQINSLLRIL